MACGHFSDRECGFAAAEGATFAACEVGMAFEEIAGVQLGIDCAGSGAPCLIFVHGGFCDRQDWSAQVRALAPRFRVVTLDLPGHGESGLCRQASVDALAQALCGVKDLHGGGNAILVGHSLGVDVSLEAYRQSPVGIAGLVLIEGGLVAHGDPEPAVNTVKERVSAVGFHGFISAAFGEMFTSRSDPRLRERVFARLKKLDTEFAREIILSKIRWDALRAAQVLAGITVPVLLIQSTYFDASFRRRSLEADTATTPFTELVTRQIPGAEVRFVPAVGHFPQIEAAEIVNEHIGTFADRVRAAGSRASSVQPVNAR